MSQPQSRARFGTEPALFAPQSEGDYIHASSRFETVHNPGTPQEVQSEIVSLKKVRSARGRIVVCAASGLTTRSIKIGVRANLLLRMISLLSA